MWHWFFCCVFMQQVHQVLSSVCLICPVWSSSHLRRCGLAFSFISDVEFCNKWSMDLFSLLGGGHLNSELHTYEAETLLLEPHLLSLCSGYLGDGGLRNYLFGLEPWSSLCQPPKYLGLQVWATSIRPFVIIKNTLHFCLTCSIPFLKIFERQTHCDSATCLSLWY
jgi:hypothetical protein